MLIDFDCCERDAKKNYLHNAVICFIKESFDLVENILEGIIVIGTTEQ